jgi:pilus assembly protein CpaB
MPIRNIATIAVALFLGLIAVVLVRNYLNQANPAATIVAGSAETTPVVVAAQAIARGTILQPGAVKLVAYPRDSVPAGSFQSVDQMLGGNAGQRFALRSLVPNEPILPGKITGPGEKLTVADALASGMRAVSLRSNEVAGVGGFVLPGDRVDVLLTRTVGTAQQTDQSIVQILAENVRVLGIDQDDNEETAKPVVTKSVTVEVTPDQSQTISLGQTVGNVTLALRHPADDAKMVRRVTTVADLSAEFPRRAPVAAAPRRAAPQAQAAAPPPPPPDLQIRVVRGTDASVYRGAENSFLSAVGDSLNNTARAAPAVVGTTP